MTTRIFSSGIRRREDPRLITGRATYTDDVVLPGMAHAAILRSPHAHAKITSLDTSAAAAADGVVAVYTGADVNAALAPVPCAWLLPDSDLKTVDHLPVANDTVRYQGDAVAVVVAENRYAAEDALELIDVEYDPLPAVVDPEEAMSADAPQLHEDAPNNQAFNWVMVGGEDSDEAFAGADVVVKERILHQRLIPNAMEPRSAVAQYTQASGDLTLWSTTQNPHIVRFLTSVVSGVPEHKVRVIAPEVGGGFGSKIPYYADEAITVFCSMQTGRPVKWTATRSEGYQSTIHGRDHVEDVELAADSSGKIKGIRSTVYAGMGAYLSTAAPGIPTILHGLMYAGTYEIPSVKADVYGVFNNAVPVDAYRGAGRPEAIFLVERMVDKLANALDKDPVEVRRNNLIPAFEDGHDVSTGLTYDSGDFATTLDMATERVGYDDLRAKQERLRGEGRYIGIGVTSYAEICGLGPSQVAGAIGFQGGLWEGAIVRFHPTGKVNVAVGTSPHGQGEETTFAQIVSDALGVEVDDVEVLHGDTDQTPMGWGTYGSRTTAVTGAALALATRKIKDKATQLAAHLLEAAVEDIDYEDGKFFVRGSPDQAKTIQDIALMANVAWDMPEGMEPGLEASTFYDPPNFTYPFGAHIAVVEVEKETGAIELKRYVACRRLRAADQPDDRGRPGAGRRRPGHRPGPLRGGSVRGRRPAADGLDARLRAAAGRHVPADRDDQQCHPIAPSPAGCEGSRGDRHDRLDDYRIQRRDGRTEALRRRQGRHAPDAGEGLAGHPLERKGVADVPGKRSLSPRELCRRGHRAPGRERGRQAHCRRAQPHPAAEAEACGAVGAHRHRQDRLAEGDELRGRDGAHRRADHSLDARLLLGPAVVQPTGIGGRGAHRRPGCPEPGHDRRQPGPRGPGVGPADRGGGAGRLRPGHGAERRPVHSRRRLLRGPDDDGPWRRRGDDLRRGAGDEGAGDGVRQDAAPGLALCGRQRRGSGDGQRR